MKDYTTSEPVFSSIIKILETSDPGHADNINVTTKQLLQNTLYLMEKLSALGRVFVGNSETQLDINDTLFVIDNDSAFDGAAYTNVTFSDDAAYVTEESTDEKAGDGLITGRLTVSENPTDDTVFLAKINS